MTRHSERMGPRRRGPLVVRHPAAAVLAIGSAVAVAVTAANCSGGDSPGSGVPPSSAGSPRATQPAGPAPRAAAPNAVAPERAVDLRPVHWHRAKAVPGRPEVRIEATLHGGPPCTVLGRVDVRETAETVTVTLWTGRRPGARCSDRRKLVGFPIVVTVSLRRPVGDRPVRDGAPTVR